MVLKAYAIMSKVIMGNGGFYGCLIEAQDVSAWWKETAQKHKHTYSFFLVNCCWITLNLSQAKPNSYYPQCQSTLSRRTLLHFCGTTFVETAVTTSLASHSRKNPLPGNISTRLRMYKVLLFKFRGHNLCKGSMCNTQALDVPRT